MVENSFGKIGVLKPDADLSGGERMGLSVRGADQQVAIVIQSGAYSRIAAGGGDDSDGFVKTAETAAVACQQSVLLPGYQQGIGVLEVGKQGSGQHGTARHAAELA